MKIHALQAWPVGTPAFGLVHVRHTPNIDNESVMRQINEDVAVLSMGSDVVPEPKGWASESRQKGVVVRALKEGSDFQLVYFTGPEVKALDKYAKKPAKKNVDQSPVETVLNQARSSGRVHELNAMA